MTWAMDWSRSVAASVAAVERFTAAAAAACSVVAVCTASPSPDDFGKGKANLPVAGPGLAVAGLPFFLCQDTGKPLSAPLYLLPVRILSQSCGMPVCPACWMLASSTAILPRSLRRLRPSTIGAQYGQSAVAKAMPLGTAPMATAFITLFMLESTAAMASAAMFLMEDKDDFCLSFLTFFLIFFS